MLKGKLVKDKKFKKEHRISESLCYGVPPFFDKY